MLLEEILSKENMTSAFKRVMSNKGAAGIDGIEVDDFKAQVNAQWPELREKILKSDYIPKAVRRVEIPKPSGGKRLLGIPTLMDRMIQQAITQVLSAMYEPGFSESSYGFRPGKNAQQAVLKAKELVNAGYTHVVDLDLEKFFDRVNHDYLMNLLSLRIEDKRLLKLIHRYLRAGVMENGVTTPSKEGMPQGGPLSPLLSNILLDKLDKELEDRGHQFVRYADDLAIYTKTKRAGDRVMESVKRYLEKELKLKVNEAKSVVTRPWKTTLLGYSFYHKKGEKAIRIAPKSIERFKERIRQITSRSKPYAMRYRYEKLVQYCRGWMNYFKLTQAPSTLKWLDEWVRRRVRLCYWKQWKKPKTKVRMLASLGAPSQKAYEWGNTRKGPWRSAVSPGLKRTLTNAYLQKEGYRSLYGYYNPLPT